MSRKMKGLTARGSLHAPMLAGLPLHWKMSASGCNMGLVQVEEKTPNCRQENPNSAKKLENQMTRARVHLLCTLTVKN